MKRLLAIALSVLAALSATADLTDGDWIFDPDPDGTTATIKGWNGSETQLDVPSTVTSGGVDYTVVALGMASIKSPSLESITIPASVNRLEDIVFMRTTNLTSIVFAGGKPALGTYWWGAETVLDRLTLYVDITADGWEEAGAAGVLNEVVQFDDDPPMEFSLRVKSKTYDASYTVSADPSPGMLMEHTAVTLDCDKAIPTDRCLLIHYTTDGSKPSIMSPAYTSPIHVTSNTTISCFAAVYSSNTNHLYTNGPVMSFAYRLPAANGGPYVENLGGTNWTFRVLNHESYLCPPAHASPCVAPDPVGALTLPSELGGWLVVGVDVSAFERCRYLTDVTFPATITTIGSFAFKDCIRLTNLVWQGTVPAIDLAAFDGCPLAGTGVTPTEPKTIYIPIEIQPDDTGAVSVPESWLDDMAVLHGTEWKANYISRFGNDFTNSLSQATGKTDAFGNPLYVWQDYVAGTDPLNATNVLSAVITMTGGAPVVTWSPDLSSATPAREYKVYGMKTLGAKLYATDVTSLSPAERKSAGYKFFYVTVTMAGQ